jgi:hypothetical protein
MAQYTTASAALFDLAQRGYSGDFKLVGNELMWVQGNVFLRMGEFSIAEFHRFWNPSIKSQNLILFAITALHYNLRGVLIFYSPISGCTSPVILKKINELKSRVVVPAFF